MGWEYHPTWLVSQLTTKKSRRWRIFSWCPGVPSRCHVIMGVIHLYQTYFSVIPKSPKPLLFWYHFLCRDWTACRHDLPSMQNFENWFIILPSDTSWRESEYIDTEELLIPYDILEGNETECENCFGDHVNRLNAAKRKERYVDLSRVYQVFVYHKPWMSGWGSITFQFHS